MSREALSLTPSTTKRRFAKGLVWALVGGLLAYPTYQNVGVWILCFPMVALIYRAVRGLNFWRGYAIGLVAGFTFFAAQTSWLSMYLGPVPLIALSLLQGLIFASFTAASQLITTKKPWLAALVFAGFWVAREWFSGNFPYGGFPWAKLVQSQADTTLARWVWLGGSPLADFLIVFAVVLVLELRGSRRRMLTISASAIVLFLAPMALPISAGAEAGSLKVAAAQGNANAGLFSNRDSGRILKNHILATNQLLSSGERFDVLVWPENAVDVDLGLPQNAAVVQKIVDRTGKPLILGTVRQEDGLYNSSELWLPKTGLAARYDKRYPVPFAEYVPDRPFWSALAPDLIGLLNYDFLPGHRSGVFDLAGRKVGVLICFEIAIDQIQHDLVNDGASVIFSQTNNSDFGKSDEAYQQLAIARLRAIETGRSIVNVSTVGPSAIYLADGSSVRQLGAFKRGFMVADVPQRTSRTPAFFLGAGFEYLCVLIALIGLVAEPFRRRR